MRESTKAFPNLGKNLTGVEIGVWRGENALSILQNTNTYLLYLIDPYEDYAEYNKNEISGHQDMDANERHAKDILKPYKDDIVWVKEMAYAAADNIPDELDYIYIDGNHKEEYIREEIRLYYPKVRKGGMLAGHDFHYSWIREVVLNLQKVTGDPLWSYPFERSNEIHDWETEWKRPETIPNVDITTDKLDWWIIKGE